MNFQMNNDIKAVLYSKEQIDEVARKLGEQITKDFEGKNPLVICVLKGAVLFMADIVRQIDTYCELDFMDVSSYGNNTVSSGEVKIIKDLAAGAVLVAGVASLACAIIILIRHIS